MNYNGYGSLAGLTEYSQHSAPSYLENSYGAAYGDYGASRDVSGGGGYRYRLLEGSPGPPQTSDTHTPSTAAEGK